jgi:hypothetical protein
MMFLNIFLAALAASALLLACDLGTNSESFTVTYNAGGEEARFRLRNRLRPGKVSRCPVRAV